MGAFTTTSPRDTTAGAGATAISAAGTSSGCAAGAWEAATGGGTLTSAKVQCSAALTGAGAGKTVGRTAAATATGAENVALVSLPGVGALVAPGTRSPPECFAPAACRLATWAGAEGMAVGALAKEVGALMAAAPVSPRSTKDLLPGEFDRSARGGKGCSMSGISLLSCRALCGSRPVPEGANPAPMTGGSCASPPGEPKPPSACLDGSSCSAGAAAAGAWAAETGW
mmetsp:Transcript_65479/g.213152  ORF Transcript_65479/g.213152 Transcript_65479/m.213152 type:complete len:227 (+) Transcript_65479:529-1209(+)